MAKESFLLVSLQESKAKKLAQVVSNESCRKILDYLTEHEVTESELAKKLGVPISTVHYNLQHLIDSGLVVAEEFHYSEKGKEVNHYKLANKYIIIAPKTVYGIKEKLKRVLPVALIGIAAAWVISFYNKFSFGAAKTAQFAEEAVMEAEPMLEEAVADTGREAVMKGAEEVVRIGGATQGSMALWFLYGAIFTIVVYLIWDWILRKREG